MQQAGLMALLQEPSQALGDTKGSLHLPRQRDTRAPHQEQRTHYSLACFILVQVRMKDMGDLKFEFGFGMFIIFYLFIVLIGLPNVSF